MNRFNSGVVQRQIRDVEPGDRIIFKNAALDYTVLEVEEIPTGQLKHRFADFQRSLLYWPNDWVYVKPGPWKDPARDDR